MSNLPVQLVGRMMISILTILLCTSPREYAATASTTMAAHDTKYIHTPMHELLQTELYLAVNSYQEIVVSYAGRGGTTRILEAMPT